MKFGPQDLFIGVIDFFSIILPGALLTFFLKGQFYSHLFGSGLLFPEPADATQGWIIFLIASYIVGNIIFLISSYCDKRLYDGWFRERYAIKNFDLAFYTATEIRKRSLNTDKIIEQHIKNNIFSEQDLKEVKNKIKLKKLDIINTYKWAKSFIAIKYPDLLTEINKVEADSKFFRSLFVAFMFMSVILLADGEYVLTLCFITLMLLSFIRYANLRYKSNDKAFEYIITIDHLNDL